MSELAQARDLLGGGDTAAALKLLERARRRALSRQDQSGLRDVVALAGPIAGSGAEGRQQRAAGRIVYAAEQNLRFLERGSALGQAVEEAGPPTVGSLVAALLVHVLVGGTWLFVAVIAVGLGDPGRFGNGPTHADYIRALTVAGALWWAAALVMVWRWWKGRQPLFVSMIWFFVAIVAAPIALGA